ncbi:MAG: N-formylglutamate amidohydrolase [Zymomonas mobilis subsp. pomaceae]|nr:N-formylglutamate amidohydrolase [Zymomonas mobilis]MDX5948248.1 N-formylglutamate amidohydrolase [Zymomonas mobilis subsp. pomaceae]GEB89003.1 N-formylglutamate amidohydrolase [Zymomonas mobilis subsp. pomaceae]
MAAILQMGEWPSRKPVLLTVPHAGRFYPENLLSQLRCKPEQLVIFEDRFVDLLMDDSVDAGFSALLATCARMVVDLNRHPHEIDPVMIDPPLARESVLLSSKVRNGLGLFPSHLAGFGSLYLRPIALHDAEERIQNYHIPWHNLIENNLENIKSRYGVSVLLDVHSMPPLKAERHKAAADIVIGTAYGHSTKKEISLLAGEIAEKSGFQVAFNKPYAGGYTLDRHGKPTSSRHALQIEINRALYLDADLYHPSDNIKNISQLIKNISEAIADNIDSFR